MKKATFILFTVLVLCGGLCQGWSYYLSGKITYQGTSLGVSNAVVTHVIYWADGSGWVSNSTQTAKDGSYSISLSSNQHDYVGASMDLKAVTSNGYYAGSTNWTCNAYVESKTLQVKSTLVVNPNLRFGLEDMNVITPGLQPMPAVAFVDAGLFAEVNMCHARLIYDPTNLFIPMIFPTPPFEFATPPVILPGEVEVFLESPFPVPLGSGEAPTPIFIAEVDFMTTDPARIESIQVETCELGIVGIAEPVVPNRTDYFLGELEGCKTNFMLDSAQDFREMLEGQLPGPRIRPAYQVEWDGIMMDWQDNLLEGAPYPPTEFCPPELFVYEGGGGGGAAGPEDGGLVMTWGEDKFAGQPDDQYYGSAFVYDYGMDPDLSNSTIQVTVTPPMSSNITAVSFTLIDINGLTRGWWWSVPGAIPYNTPTLVTIDCSQTGLAATTPVASGYQSNPGFDITKVQFLNVDENFQYIFGTQPVPPPGQQQFMGAWNYWHNLLVTPNVSPRAYKGTWVKWSQPVVVLEEDPPLINGWDEVSDYFNGPVMADDWKCTDERPITDIHWWGSFKGWNLNIPPAIMPQAFHLGIWTDVPAGGPDNQFPYSHPGRLIWEHVCDTYVWNFAGWDIDPRPEPEPEDTCFQFNQLLPQNAWFWQDPNDHVYWLSIAPIYDPSQIEPGVDFYKWGWKTRPHFFNDDAVRTRDATIWPVKVGSVWNAGEPVQIPEYPEPGVSWDLAFELTTNEQPECYTLPADLNHDCIVDLADFSFFAQQWLSIE